MWRYQSLSGKACGFLQNPQHRQELWGSWPRQMAEQLPGDGTVVKSPLWMSRLLPPESFWSGMPPEPALGPRTQQGEQSPSDGHHTTDSGAPPADRNVCWLLCVWLLGRKAERAKPLTKPRIDLEPTTTGPRPERSAAVPLSQWRLSWEAPAVLQSVFSGPHSVSAWRISSFRGASRKMCSLGDMGEFGSWHGPALPTDLSTEAQAVLECRLRALVPHWPPAGCQVLGYRGREMLVGSTEKPGSATPWCSVSAPWLDAGRCLL